MNRERFFLCKTIIIIFQNGMVENIIYDCSRNLSTNFMLLIPKLSYNNTYNILCIYTKLQYSFILVFDCVLGKEKKRNGFIHSL